VIKIKSVHFFGHLARFFGRAADIVANCTTEGGMERWEGNINGSYADNVCAREKEGESRVPWRDERGNEKGWALGTRREERIGRKENRREEEGRWRRGARKARGCLLLVT
jgi:hypothetical protein